MGGYHVESHADQSAVVGVGKDDDYDCNEYDDDDDDGMYSIIGAICMEFSLIQRILTHIYCR